MHAKPKKSWPCVFVYIYYFFSEIKWEIWHKIISCLYKKMVCKHLCAKLQSGVVQKRISNVALASITCRVLFLRQIVFDFLMKSNIIFCIYCLHSSIPQMSNIIKLSVIHEKHMWYHTYITNHEIYQFSENNLKHYIYTQHITVP